MKKYTEQFQERTQISQTKNKSDKTFVRLMNSTIYEKIMQSASKKPGVRLASSMKKAENYCKLNCNHRTKAQNLGSNAHGKERVVLKKATDAGISDSDSSCKIFTVKCLNPWWTVSYVECFLRNCNRTHKN